MALQDTRKYILLLESRYRDSDIGGMAREARPGQSLSWRCVEGSDWIAWS